MQDQDYMPSTSSRCNSPSTFVGRPSPVLAASDDAQPESGSYQRDRPFTAKQKSIVPLWRGVLTWKSAEPGTDVKQDITMDVEAFAMFASAEKDLLPETWPPVLSIVPSKEQAFPVFAIYNWVLQNNATPMLFSPLSGSSAGRVNEETYVMLIRFLVENNIYALTSWCPPNSLLAAKNHILFLQLNSNTLAGVFFPTSGGVPELPPICDALLTSPTPTSTTELAALFAKMNPEQKATLLQMPPEQRVAWMKTVVQRHLQFRQQEAAMVPSMPALQVAPHFDLQPDMWSPQEESRSLRPSSPPSAPRPTPRSSFPFLNPIGPRLWPRGVLPRLSFVLDPVNMPPPAPAPRGVGRREVSLLADTCREPVIEMDSGALL